MEDLSRSTNFDQFVRDLTNSEKVKTYIQSRNLDDIHIANKDLGFCSPYSRNMFPLLRGRLIVPIRDVHGRLIALAGRQVPDFIEVTIASFWDTFKSEPAKADDRINKWLKGKWINEPYQKSRHLFNLDRAKSSIRDCNFVFIVEGYFDVLILKQKGIENVVALCGTALSEYHLALLYRYCDRVVLLLDGDDAGRLASEKIIQKLNDNNFIGKILHLPEKCDPDDFVINYGPQNLIDAANQLLDSEQSFLKIIVS